MFDQVLKMVKEQMEAHPEAAQAIPAGQQDAVHHEVATQITNGLATQAAQQGGIGGLLSMLQGGLSSGSPVTGAISGGLVSSLGAKFGLPPAATGAIAGALPGLLEKFANKANDTNDHSITQDSITQSLSKMGGLGGLFK